MRGLLANCGVLAFALLIHVHCEAAFNVEIRTTGPSTGGSWSAGVWTPSASPSRIAISDLLARLVAGNVTIGTGTTGAEPGNIIFFDAIDRASSSSSFSRTLTLNAAGSVNFAAAFIDSDGTRSVSLVINPATGGLTTFGGDLYTSGGGITVTAGAVAQSATRNISTGGGAIQFTSTAAVTLNGSTINTSGGSVTIVGAADSTFGAAITTSGGNVDATINGTGSDLTVNGSITVSGGAGVGSVTLRSTAGLLTQSASSSITTSASGATLRGGSGVALSGDISSPGGLIDIDVTGTGSIAVNGTSLISALGGSNAGSVEMNTANGSITLASGSVARSGSNGNLIVRAAGTGATINAAGVVVAGTGTTGLSLRGDDGVTYSSPIAVTGRILIDANANGDTVGSLTLNHSVTGDRGVELRGRGITGVAGAAITSSNFPILVQSGAAVDIVGVVQSGGGSITISAASTLDVGTGQISSGGGTVAISSVNAMSLFGPITTSGGAFNASVTGTGGLSIQNDMTSNGGDITITAANGALQSTSGADVSATGGAGVGRIVLTSSNGSQSLALAGQVHAGTRGISISAGDNVTLNATVTAPGNIDLIADSNNGGVGTLTISAPVVATSSGAITLRGFTLSQTSTGTVSTNGGSINGEFAGAVTISRTLGSTAGSLFFRSLGALTLSVGLNGAQGVELRGNGVTGNAGGTVTSGTGPILIQSTAAVDLIAAIQSSGGSITIGAATTLTVGTGAINSSGGNVALTSISTMSVLSPVVTGGGTFTANTTGTGALSIQNDVTSSGGNIVVTAANGLASTSAGSDLDATGGAGTGSIAFTSSNGTQSLVAGGQLRAGTGGIALSAGNDATINAPVTTSGNLTIAADTNVGGIGTVALNNAVTTTSTGTITITGRSFTQTAPGTITSAGGAISAYIFFAYTVSAAVNSSGGPISLRSDAGLTVSAAVSSLPPGSGFGTLRWYGNVSATVFPTVGAGEITLDGGGADLVISSPFNLATHTEFGANRDVIISAAVTTQAGRDLFITSGRAGVNAIGGVALLGTGVLSSGRHLVVRARQANHPAAVGSAVFSAGTANTMSATGNLRIAGAASSPSGAGISLGGSVFANPGSVHISTPRGLTFANGASAVATIGTSLLQVGEQFVQSAGSSIEVIGGSNLVATIGGNATVESFRNATPAGAISISVGGNIAPRAVGNNHFTGDRIALTSNAAIGASATRIRLDATSVATQSQLGTSIETQVTTRPFVLANATALSALEISTTTGTNTTIATLPALNTSSVTGVGEFNISCPAAATLRFDHPITVNTESLNVSCGILTVNAPVTTGSATLTGISFAQGANGSISVIEGTLNAQYSGAAVISQPLSSNGNNIEFFASGGLTVSATVSSAPPVGGSGVLLTNAGVTLNAPPVLGDGDIILRGSPCASGYVATTACNLDIDGDGVVGVRDAVIGVRRMLGMRDLSLVQGLVFDSCTTRYRASTLQAFIDPKLANDVAHGGIPYDFDGDTQVRGPTDGAVLVRAALGLPASVVIGGPVVVIGAPRANVTSLRTYLNTTCGLNLAP